MTRFPQPAGSFFVLEATPKGRVVDIDEWIQMCSDSLKKFTGRSLVESMNGIEELVDVHDCERYAVLSHGTQEDPIYKYFNKGALLTFQYSEDEAYQLPSRYSAPDGDTRTERATLMNKIVAEEVGRFPTAIRQNKSGEQFQLTDVILWNVYDKGIHVGQTALFDRAKIVPL
jgi:hypothetical protein